MQKIKDIYHNFLNRKETQKVRSILGKFFDSDLYIIFFLLVALANWKFHFAYLAIPVGLFLILLIFIFDFNRFRLIPIILFGIASLRLETRVVYLTPALIVAAVVMPLLIYDLFRKKTNFSNQVLIGMIFLLIASIFSAVNAPDWQSPVLGASTMVFYIFLFAYFYNLKNQFDPFQTRIYLARCFTYFGLMIFAETMIYNLEIFEGGTILDFFNWKTIDLSWANINYVAMMYLLAIPLTCYWFVQYQKKYQLILALIIELFGLVLTLSRGAYLAVLITFLPLIIKFLGDIKNKTEFMKKAFMVIIFILLVLLLIGIPTGVVKSFYEVLNQRGVSLTGREILYRVGLSVFLRYPLFGGGLYTSEYYISLVGTNTYYHNFIIQTLATLGIMGMIAFIYYLFQMIRQSLLKCDYNIYVFFIILNLLVHGMFDTTFYNPLVMATLSIILPLMSEKKDLTISSGEETPNVHNQSQPANSAV